MLPHIHNSNAVVCRISLCQPYMAVKSWKTKTLHLYFSETKHESITIICYSRYYNFIAIYRKASLFCVGRHILDVIYPWKLQKGLNNQMYHSFSKKQTGHKWTSYSGMQCIKRYFCRNPSNLTEHGKCLTFFTLFSQLPCFSVSSL